MKAGRKAGRKSSRKAGGQEARKGGGKRGREGGRAVSLLLAPVHSNETQAEFLLPQQACSLFEAIWKQLNERNKQVDIAVYGQLTETHRQ